MATNTDMICRGRTIILSSLPSSMIAAAVRRPRAISSMPETWATTRSSTETLSRRSLASKLNPPGMPPERRMTRPIRIVCGGRENKRCV